MKTSHWPHGHFGSTLCRISREIQWFLWKQISLRNKKRDPNIPVRVLTDLWWFRDINHWIRNISARSNRLSTPQGPNSFFFNGPDFRCPIFRIFYGSELFNPGGWPRKHAVGLNVAVAISHWGNTEQALQSRHLLSSNIPYPRGAYGPCYVLKVLGLDGLEPPPGDQNPNPTLPNPNQSKPKQTKSKRTPKVKKMHFTKVTGPEV